MSPTPSKLSALATLGLTLALSAQAADPKPSGQGVLNIAPESAASRDKNAPPASSSGPAPVDEAKLLFTQAHEAFRAGKYAEAVPLLERMIHRHPSEPGFLDSHLFLGVCRLRLGQPADAIPPLRFYIEAQGARVEGTLSRPLLGEALIDAGRYTQAQLVAMETIQRTGPKATGTLRETRTHALLERAHAQLAQRKLNQAEGTLRDALAEKSVLQDTPALATYAARVQLGLKRARCAQLPSSARMPEDQTLDQFNRRGICLLEATEPLMDALRWGEPKPARQALEDFRGAYQDYAHAVANPPRLPGAKAGSPTDQKYRSELTDRLRLSLRDNLSQMDALLASRAASVQDAWVEEFRKLRADLSGLK